jgi:acetyltransferase-like isoleucine patch superfamily enzyme
MSFEFLVDVPYMNPNDDEVLLVSLEIAVGVCVAKDDLLATVETSKAVTEILAPVSGKIKSILADPGTMLKVGDQLLVLETEKEVGQAINRRKIEDHSRQIPAEISEKEYMDPQEVGGVSGKGALKKKLDEWRKLTEVQEDFNINYLSTHKRIVGGDNCFISCNVSMTNVRLGDRVWVNRDCHIFSNSKDNPISIGSGSYIGPYVWIEGHGGIQIGETTHISGPGTCIFTHSGMKTALQGEYALNPEDEEVYDNHFFTQPVEIGNSVWIGPNCTIFPGASISDFVVVMPNTLVRAGRIPSFSLVRPDGTVEKDSRFVKKLAEKTNNIQVRTP